MHSSAACRSAVSVISAVIILPCCGDGATSSGGSAAPLQGANVLDSAVMVDAGFPLDAAKAQPEAVADGQPGSVGGEADMLPMPVDSPTEAGAPLKSCDDPENKPKCDKENGKCVPGVDGKGATCKCADGLDGDPYVDGGCSKNVLECENGLDNCDPVSTKCDDMHPLDPANTLGLPFVCTCLVAKGFTIKLKGGACACSTGKAIMDGECQCKTGTVDDDKGGCVKPCGGKCAADAECGVDKCGNSCGTCKANATCDVDKCVCAAGYAKSAATGVCVLKNVCGTPDQTKVCDKNATCVATATPGVSDCQCNVGFVPTGSLCAFADKCQTSNGGCSSNATCSMDPSTGAVACKCKVGFSGDGKQCDNVNECQTSNGGCDKNATCVDLPGSVTCTCNAGWTGGGKQCADVDECQTGNGGCAATAVCENLPGGAQCVCGPGYTGNGKTCADVDECKVNSGGCPANSACLNSAGSYDCACAGGYSKVAGQCVDVDECKIGSAYCSPNAACTNLPGDYKCDCKAGFKGDGQQCVVDKTCSPACDQNANCVGVDGQP